MFHKQPRRERAMRRAWKTILFWLKKKEKKEWVRHTRIPLRCMKKRSYFSSFNLSEIKINGERFIVGEIFIRSAFSLMTNERILMHFTVYTMDSFKVKLCLWILITLKCFRQSHIFYTHAAAPLDLNSFWQKCHIKFYHFSCGICRIIIKLLVALALCCSYSNI